MEVGAKDGVDAGGREAGGGEIGEEPRLQMAPGRHRSLLVVADAGIDDDPPRRRFDHQGVDAHLQAALFVGEMGREPGDLAHHLSRRLRQDEPAAAHRLELHDLGDGDFADPPFQGHWGFLNFTCS